MGEAAEDILNGLVCEGCGEWFLDDEELGHPRKCSNCKRSARKERDPNGPFICHSDRALHALPFWLKERPMFNSARDNITFGKRPCIGLIFEDKTEIGAARFADAGIINCLDDAMREKTMEIVNRAIRRRNPKGGLEP